jgi:lipoprotein-releasing system permease protein
MRYELFIALRYLKAKRKQTFVSVITVISVLGIIIGVTALIIALALITGFHENIQEKILGANSHILLFNALPEHPIDHYQSLIKKLEKRPHIIAAAPTALSKGMISSKYASEGVVIYGVDPDSIKKVTNIFDNIIKGSYQPLKQEEAEGRGSIILGKELAARLGVLPGHTVRVMSIDATSLSPFGLLPKPKNFRVAGIFESGMWEADLQWAFISLKQAQRFFNLGDGVTLIQVKVDDIFRVKEIAEDLREHLGGGFYIQDWMDMNEPFFSALKLEKLLLFIAIGLIVTVAAFNIVITLVMMVMEKNRDIGILMSMGATSKSVMLAFMLQGIIIGIIGTALGAALGLGLCWVLDTYRLISLPPDVYTISYLPFKVRIGDFIGVMAMALGISFLATLYPSYRASKLRPAEALHYE